MFYLGLAGTADAARQVVRGAGHLEQTSHAGVRGGGPGDTVAVTTRWGTDNAHLVAAHLAGDGMAFQELVTAMGTWRCNPYHHNGTPTAVCTAITFIYPDKTP